MPQRGGAAARSLHGSRPKWRGLAHTRASAARSACGVAAAGGAWGSTRTPARALWAQWGPVGQVKEGWDSSAQRGDGEVEWRHGAAARDGVLTGEGVDGDIGEIQELRRGEREIRATSIE
jgi:hypothetical protein